MDKIKNFLEKSLEWLREWVWEAPMCFLEDHWWALVLFQVIVSALVSYATCYLMWTYVLQR